MKITMKDFIKLIVKEDCDNETILSIVIGDAIDNDSRKIPNYEKQTRNIALLPTTRTFNWLDYEIDTAFAAGNALYVWTTNHVLFISTHDDGSMWLRNVPRHPCSCEPETIDG